MHSMTHSALGHIEATRPEVAGAAESFRATVQSPVGPLTLTERDGAIVEVTWRARVGAKTHASPLLDEARQQLAAYFARKLMRFDLPLAPAGSEFQQQVWQAMLRIPFGATKTYGEIATALGANARAVGGACGSNPIPVIIPCHRIVGAGDTLGGYSGAGGAATKRFLLTLEGALLL